MDARRALKKRSRSRVDEIVEGAQEAGWMHGGRSRSRVDAIVEGAQEAGWMLGLFQGIFMYCMFVR